MGQAPPHGPHATVAAPEPTVLYYMGFSLLPLLGSAVGPRQHEESLLIWKMRLSLKLIATNSKLTSPFMVFSDMYTICEEACSRCLEVSKCHA